MVNWPSAIFSSRKEAKTLMLGIDGAGKTTILYKLKLGEIVTTIPDISWNVETVNYKNISFAIWDVGGQEKVRVLWKHSQCRIPSLHGPSSFSHYNPRKVLLEWHNNDAVIFVVDSNDRERISEAKEVLQQRILDDDDDLRDVPLLVYANKQDLPDAMGVSEITEHLGLHGLEKRAWYVQAASSHSGKGLYEGLE